MRSTATFETALLLGFSEGAPQDLRTALAARCRRLVDGASPDPYVEVVVLDAGATLEPELLGALPGLRVVAVYGTDVSGIDAAALAARGIHLLNVPGYATDSVAEFVFAAVLAQVRRLYEAQADLVLGRALARSGSTLRGRTLGGLGLGRIGARTAQIARQGFGMDVRYWSRTRRPALERAHELAPRGRLALLSEAEILSVHLALNEETRGLLDRAAVEALRPGALVVCTSPMDLWDLDALAGRLEEGGISLVIDDAAALDPSLRERFARAGAVLYPSTACTTASAGRAKLEAFTLSLDALPGATRPLLRVDAAGG